MHTSLWPATLACVLALIALLPRSLAVSSPGSYGNYDFPYAAAKSMCSSKQGTSSAGSTGNGEQADCCHKHTHTHT